MTKDDSIGNKKEREREGTCVTRLIATLEKIDWEEKNRGRRERRKIYRGFFNWNDNFNYACVVRELSKLKIFRK